MCPALRRCLEAGVLAMHPAGPSTALWLIVLHGRDKLTWLLEQAGQCHAVSVSEVEARRQVLRGRWEAIGAVQGEGRALIAKQLLSRCYHLLNALLC